MCILCIRVNPFKSTLVMVEVCTMIDYLIKFHLLSEVIRCGSAAAGSAAAGSTAAGSAEPPRSGLCKMTTVPSRRLTAQPTEYPLSASFNLWRASV